jgi:hypothetical protein
VSKPPRYLPSRAAAQLTQGTFPSPNDATRFPFDKDNLLSATGHVYHLLIVTLGDAARNCLQYDAESSSIRHPPLTAIAGIFRSDLRKSTRDVSIEFAKAA